MYNVAMLKTKFAREMTVILCVKLTLLYSLWNICFKNTKQPVDFNSLTAAVYGISVKD